MVKAGASEMAIVAVFVAFAAGYIITPTGQKALKDATEARYLSPIDIFVFSMLAALSFEVKSKRFQRLQEYPAVCMMLASSSIAYIFLHSRGSFAWTAYLPPALVFYVFVIPERVHVHRLVIGCTASGIASSCAMAIRNRLGAICRRLGAICRRLGAIPDEGIPL